MDDFKSRIREQVENLAPELEDISRKMYDNPECAYEERESSRLAAQFLEGHGFDVELGAGKVETAFLAKPKGAKPTEPKIAFLAEYDALPKIGHGCGHNLIACATLGAAAALLEVRPDLAGSFMVVGTPAEEGGGGKALLAEAGIFEGVSASFMFHPGQTYHLGSGSLGRIKARVEFFGQSSHAAATPEKGVNALDAVVLAYNNISALRQQLPSDVRIHGIIENGGEAPNVIPDYTSSLYYIRTINKEYLDILFKKFQDCCQGAALATGCRAEVKVLGPSLDPMKRNRALEEAWKNNMKPLGLEPDYSEIGIGSTDLGNVSQLMPVVQPYLPICGAETSFHTVEFAEATQSDKGKKAVMDAAKLLAMTALDYLASEELQEKAAREFNGA
ncbi:amidohydrolase [Dethiosulfatarculus sandiegensis]|uniref:Peptidase M20 domain-containing protein 2 n=1 Tax=Dethiosulfatarculus sandiegensis TaxID=1429043 RepID=A0A0D2JCA9_9BACT|nr:amidohydrolase [Dethiosulfatarculus sandiegensis]